MVMRVQTRTYLYGPAVALGQLIADEQPGGRHEIRVLFERDFLLEAIFDRYRRAR